MVFSSITFIFFFLPLVLVAYYVVPRKLRDVRNLILLLFSLVFYAFSGLRFLPIMLAAILINYAGAFLISKFDEQKKWILGIGVALNLSLLIWFKYIGFFAKTISAVGVPIQIPEVVLPIGISFYTFQGVSYLVDVYRDPKLCQKNPFKVALYISFFPQLIAGPIVRYEDVAIAIDSNRESIDELSDGLVRFIYGLGKKVLLANIFGEIAAPIFAMGMSQLASTTAWVGAIAYSLQLYFDFSGYSDMAIGLGKMFGFHFPENFNYPYIATSVTDFWRRWHMSLSKWFRDYVYIPLGGNRVKLSRHIVNLLIVWSLTGFWHGAAWNFLLWGLWYGVLLILEKYVLHSLIEKLPNFITWIITMVLVIVGGVIFNSDSLAGVGRMLGAMLGNGNGNNIQVYYYLREYWIEWIVGLLLCTPICQVIAKFLQRKQWIYSISTKIVAMIILALSYMNLVAESMNPFLYFRF